MSQFLHGIEVKEIDGGLRPIRMVTSSVIGLIGTAPDAADDDYPLDTPVLVTGAAMAYKLGAGGTLRDAWRAVAAQGVNVAIVVRVADGETMQASIANVTGDAAAGTGAFALLASASVTGQTPRILAAPGWTSTDGSAKSPVTDALVSVAGALRGVVIADGPNTTEAAALSDRGHHGSDRLYIVDPAVRVFDAATATTVTRPASGYAAGVLSRTDAERGFWWSPSNREVMGITGTARPIPFAIGSPETEASRLNGAEVATIIRGNGFRLWGNRTTSADPLWAFLPVRRTADMIYESIEQALMWAMDRPFSDQLLRDIRDSVKSYLNSLIARGALLGGKVWLDPDLNTDATLKAGQLYLDFDIEPPAPLERLTFRAHRNGQYYDELVARVGAAS